MRNLTIFTIASLMGLTAAATITLGSPDTAPSGAVAGAEVCDSLTSAEGDSIIVRSEAEVRGERASELYKTVKFMLYEGELESNLYPAAYEANEAAMAALEVAELQADIDRATSIIVDLNPLMAHGAVYYSGQGDSGRQADFARAYVDAQSMPRLSAAPFQRDERLFPQLAYCAAYGATQAQDTEAAKRYFRLYLDSGDEAQRQNVIKYYAQACLVSGDYEEGLTVLEDGTVRYPTDMQMLTLAIQTCLDGKLTHRMQPLLDKALALNPNEEKLINLQAQLLERAGEYGPAVDQYLRLAETHPNSLEINQALARCYYNLGASHYNASIMEEDEKAATRHRRQSRTYFNSAVNALGHVLANTPSDMTFLRALASAYAALGDRDNFDETNKKIMAFGGQGVAFNSMPVMIAAEGGADAAQSAIPASTAAKVPTFEEFAAPLITEQLGQWARRGEFEKIDDYRKRLNSGGAETRYEQLLKQAEREYLEKYASRLVVTDMRLSPYDPDNEVYRIDTPYGVTTVRVPVKNQEAEGFKADWASAQLRTPRFIIRDNKPVLSSITYVVNGKKYEYNAEDAANYQTPHVYVDLAGILNPGDDTSGGADDTAPVAVFIDSDVDVNIPVTGKKAGNLFALIIANEHYAQADDVFGALHDGDTFRKYCARTLGVPEENIVAVNNATGNQVRDALARLSRKVKGAGPDAEAIVFYAGHGLPDEQTMEAYMMPVDANPLLMTTMIPMKEFYSTLGDMQAASTSVFVDACFSGTDRDGSMINKARGVAFATRPATAEGNMFILTAASAKETAMPYREKGHGLFSYFLLKKLQESKGNTSLRQLADDVIKNVRQAAETVNGKPQTPTVATSGTLSTSWDSKKLKP